MVAFARRGQRPVEVGERFVVYHINEATCLVQLEEFVGKSLKPLRKIREFREELLWAKGQ